ncbi:polysaccharide export outer membrane protein [Arboricoccus pini]|uniref:Polysaccharide export outer membrane protein n=1 Tax=Arboricoccus pini TaxID=1963835 RepID=A0A212RS68_9PROT|nr:polysaccharide biosynthesis/export family protein [Arboricoccus pini]SNB75485.1 polysaccharide export outer membrane protein [Arboricoccus pini]
MHEIALPPRRHPQTRSRPPKGAGPALSRRALATLLGATAIAACAPKDDLAFLPDTPTTDSPYKLGPGDQVRLIVFNEPQLSGDFRVSDSGTIDMPLLGAVKATGLTTDQLAKNVTDQLKGRNLLTDASVAAEVSAYRPIFVLGEVNNPGQYPFQPGMTVLTAVALAGGFTYRAFQDYGTVIRTSDQASTENRIARSGRLEPGDVLNILERRF